MLNSAQKLLSVVETPPIPSLRDASSSLRTQITNTSSSSSSTTTESPLFILMQTPSPEDLLQCRQVYMSTVNVDALERLLMGTFAPILSFITLLINACAIAVLMHKSFRRSPSHVVLLSIFAVDMATAGVPLPFCIYFYTMGYYETYLPFIPCYLRQLIMRLAPTITNTASIWLFTYLALQRYLIVCKGIQKTNVGRFHTWAVSVAQTRPSHCIAAIIATAVLIHSIQLVDRYPGSLTCPAKWDGFSDTEQVEIVYDYDYEEADPSATIPNSTPLVDTCHLGSRFNEKLPAKVATSIYASYYVTRAIFIHLLPCALVTFATCSLIIEVRKANRRKKRLHGPMGQALRTAAATVVSIQLESIKAAQLKQKATAALLLETVPESGSEDDQVKGPQSPPSESGRKGVVLRESLRLQRRIVVSKQMSLPIKTDKAVGATPEFPVEAAPITNRSTSVPSGANNPTQRDSSNSIQLFKNMLGRMMTTGFAKALRPDKDYSITSMLTAIMCVFLLVQLPQAFVFIWGILSGLGLVVTSEQAAYGFDLALKILNILYLLTFPVQSGLCFIMNRPFRQSFLCMLGLITTPASGPGGGGAADGGENVNNKNKNNAGEGEPNQNQQQPVLLNHYQKHNQNYRRQQASGGAIF